MKHLWEIDHPYYCAEENFFKAGCATRYRSWLEFIQAEGDSDPDLNLVFRFDWHEGEDWSLGEFNGDEHYRNGELLIFWMGQRKGLFRSTEIQVCRADEPAVLDWLKGRYEHLLKLWEPFASEKREDGDG